MMDIINKLLTQQNIKRLSIIILLVSFILVYYNKSLTPQTMQLEYELINTKDMAMVKVAEKKTTTNNKDGSKSVFQIYKEMKTGNYETESTLTPVSLPTKQNTVSTLTAPKRIWYLPTEMGTITSYPSASHFALDITSPRGTGEAIYPVANGVISSIYTDYAGAKIVMVNHNINGKVYTSQYVHLSRYAPNLYVGKPVTINDYLGFMGQTGIATGNHLHIALVDCSYLNGNSSCPNLNSFFTYGKSRYYQGFKGLQSVMNVPTSWTSR